MPKCLNDNTKNYKGDEPSPKGFGYCAHGEEEGIIRLGTDANAWIVTKSSNGVKKWSIQSKEVFPSDPITVLPKVKDNDIKISHLKPSQQTNFLHFVNNQQLILDLQQLGVTFIKAQWADWKMGDVYKLDNQIVFEGPKQTLRLSEKRDDLDWNNDDTKEQTLTEDLEDNKIPFILALVIYDSIKKQFLEIDDTRILFMTNICLTRQNIKSKQKRQQIEQENHSHLVNPIQQIFKKHFGSKYHWDGEHHLII